MEGMDGAAGATQAWLFARRRGQAGIDSETVHVPEGSAVKDVYAALRDAHPSLESNLDSVRPAINQEFSDWDAVVGDGDEVAFIPPVSGGTNAAGVMFEVTAEPLDARRAESAVPHSRAGAICTFTGIVRGSAPRPAATNLEYEAFAEMATAEMRKIADEI